METAVVEITDHWGEAIWFGVVDGELEHFLEAIVELCGEFDLV